MAQTTKAYKGNTVYVVDGSRTPQIKALGKPGPFSASDLALSASRSLMARLPISPSDLDEVIMGCVMPGPDEANIARLLALRLGCSHDIPAWTVQRNCASGLQSIDNAAHNIANGVSDLVLAGGTEAMSHAPLLLKPAMVVWLSELNRSRGIMARSKQLLRLRLSYLQPVIGLLRGLTDPVINMSMGQTAEKLAYLFDISREEMDAYAVQSHQRLAQALDENYLAEIEPVYDTNGHCYTEDNGLRRDSNTAALAKLRPVFDRGFGKVTAGNSAQVTDGAACLLLASEKAIEKHNLPILGRIVDSQWAGVDPSQMGLGPVHAMTPIMQRHKLNIDDVDYWEINEAFAAQVLACKKAWESEKYCQDQLKLKAAMGSIDTDRLNIDGGGISMGHPVGASGARIVLHLLHVLARKQADRGIASLCIGGGQGGAILVERIKE